MKKLAIMQPYLFPYIGYFSLIKHTDEFVLFDPVQFIRHGWIERNRILKQDSGWIYVKVPLIKDQGNHGTAIKDVKIDNSKEWKRTILSQIEPYKRIAPHYHAVRRLLEDLFELEYINIVSLNRAALQAVCQYLGFSREFPVFSQMGLEIQTPTAPDEWALNICLAIGGVAEYWNPPGGQEFFNKSKYDQAGIALKFLKVNLHPYDQRRQEFEAGLSILDVMMFSSPAQINQMLDDYELI